MAEAKPINIFTTILLVFLGLSVIVPFVNIALETGQATTNDYNQLESIVSGSNYLSIVLNIIFVMFWTFGLPSFVNLYILLPLRIIGLICAWYIISPAK